MQHTHSLVHTKGASVQDSAQSEGIRAVLHKLPFPVIPDLQQLMAGGCANQPWMNQSWEPDACTMRPESEGMLEMQN